MSTQVAAEGGGLVKKLLFPAFEAGNNVTYKPSSTSPSVVNSEASTVVRDNRSNDPPTFFHSTKPALVESSRVKTTVRSISMTAVADAPMETRNNTDTDDRSVHSGSSCGLPKAVRSVMDDEEEDEEFWEEEATPAQTAFGKQLIFQRVSRENDEVLSTASENGSIIESSDRLRDVDMLLQREHLALPLLNDEALDGDEKKVDWNGRSPTKATSDALSVAIKQITSAPGTPRSLQSMGSPLSPRRTFRNTDSKASTPNSKTSTPNSSKGSPLVGTFSTFPPSPFVNTSTSPGSAASAYAEATSGRERDLLPRRRQPQSKQKRPFLPVRSCFSFDVSDSTIPYRGGPSRWISKSWDMSSSSLRTGKTNKSESQQLLKTPKRVEIERDDALDILSCLVEQGVSWKSEETNSVKQQSEQQPPEKSAEQVAPPVLEPIVSPSTSELTAVIQDLHKQLPTYDPNSSSKRQECLDELLRSHEYALEMKRATKSASSWLRSIGRDASLPSPTMVSDTGTVQSEITDERCIDALTTKAQLHAAQMEAQDRSDMADRLNEELAQCRAEIGRLRTQRSPQLNRSVLDEEEEEEMSDLVAVQEDNMLFEKEENTLTSSFLKEHDTEQDELHHCKAALDEANKTIEVLRSQLGQRADSLTSLIDTPSPAPKGQQIVDGRALDTEDIDTDWGDLAPPIPFLPPKHDLRSPIVTAVLQSWSDDTKLHDSLMTWMDQVLSGESQVPPLTLSGLNHQVRDGFCIHILPHLFTKREIRVGIQSRLQRRTTYDIAVTVQPRMSDEDSLNASTATTALVSNRDLARLSYDEIAESNLQSPDDADEEARTGAWSTLGGALWGSLTTNRRKVIADVEEPYHRVVSAPAGRIGVTFVEYRGHCMVSDVAADSPLLNWVFPSDVLIAIDEVCVSGMRVRDIIKVLKERSDRQRALRVVSSHTMSELTGSS